MQQSFDEWINHVGIATLARQLRVTKQTVYNWKWGRDPKVCHLRKIRKMSRGVITYEMIVDRKVTR